MSDRNNLENLELNGRVILECFLKKGDGSLEWIDLAHCRFKWPVPLSDVIKCMNFLICLAPVSFSRMTLLHRV
jgi:hypothetical protein